MNARNFTAALAIACTFATATKTMAAISQQAYIKPTNTTAGNEFGTSVAVSGTTMVVGAPGKTGGGAAYVFVRNGGTWTQQAELTGDNTESGDGFGCSVSISGDTIVVGANAEDGGGKGVNPSGSGSNNLASASGAAYVFVRSGGTWSEQAYIKASNTGAGDNFGDSVSISGDLIVVGATGEDSPGVGINSNQSQYDVLSSSGAAYVFTRSGTTWSQQAYLKASNTGASDWFGTSVAASGETVIVGATGEDGKATGVNGVQGDYTGYSNVGAAYVFVRNSGTWSQQAYLKPSNTQLGLDYFFGSSVSISGNDIIVGARNEGSNSSGAAYTFSRSGSTWTPGAYLKASNVQKDDKFGQSVSISGDFAVVSASSEDSSATGMDGDQANDLASGSGAVYLFGRSNGTWSQLHYIKASNTDVGDQFGYSVALSDGILAVGAIGEDSASTGVNGNETDNSSANAGAAYVFSVPATFTLSVSAEFGTITGSGTHPAGAPATITATPDPGYLFSGWTGDAAGNSNPLQILMDSDKTVGGTFQQDLSDNDHDGLTAYQELAVHGTNPSNADSDNDGIDDKTELEKGLSPILADSDGDGTNDGAEIEFGSNPLDAAVKAPFQARVKSFSPTSGCVIRFTAETGETYQIETSTDLSNWTAEETGIAGQGNVVERTYPAAGAHAKYYRVKQNSR